MGSPYIPLVLKSVHKYGQGKGRQTNKRYYELYYIDAHSALQTVLENLLFQCENGGFPSTDCRAF